MFENLFIVLENLFYFGIQESAEGPPKNRPNPLAPLVEKGKWVIIRNLYYVEDKKTCIYTVII